ncbi:hypothetical protein ACF052_09520 [Streptomyces pilosus]|uniref:hypothetical protein n=1 Tax=Streptomyces pilosus TaxID=28893 RepID=UPI0036F9502A
MNENDCFPLLLSQREFSTIDARIRMSTSKADVTDILDWYELSEDDFVAGFPDLAKTVQELPDEHPPGV